VLEPTRLDDVDDGAGEGDEVFTEFYELSILANLVEHSLLVVAVGIAAGSRDVDVTPDIASAGGALVGVDQLGFEQVDILAFAGVPHLGGDDFHVVDDVAAVAHAALGEGRVGAPALGTGFQHFFALADTLHHVADVPVVELDLDVLVVVARLAVVLPVSEHFDLFLGEDGHDAHVVVELDVATILLGELGVLEPLRLEVFDIVYALGHVDDLARPSHVDALAFTTALEGQTQVGLASTVKAEATGDAFGVGSIAGGASRVDACAVVVADGIQEQLVQVAQVVNDFCVVLALLGSEIVRSLSLFTEGHDALAP